MKKPTKEKKSSDSIDCAILVCVWASVSHRAQLAGPDMKWMLGDGHL